MFRLVNKEYAEYFANELDLHFAGFLTQYTILRITAYALMTLRLMFLEYVHSRPLHATSMSRLGSIRPLLPIFLGFLGVPCGLSRVLFDFQRE